MPRRRLADVSSDPVGGSQTQLRASLATTLIDVAATSICSGGTVGILRALHRALAR